MTNYGPLTNLWEGSDLGERYLHYTKPMVMNVHTKNWHVQALDKLQTKNHWAQLLIFTC